MKAVSKLILIIVMTAFVVVIAFFTLTINLKDMAPAPTVYAAEKLSEDTVAYNVELPGKNLFNIGKLINNDVAEKYNNGLKLTKRATGRFSERIPMSVPAGTYRMSFDIIEQTTMYILKRVFYIDDSTYTIPASGECTFTKDVKSVEFFADIPDAVGTGFTIDNIQIEKGSTATDYERYKGYTPSTKSVNTINMEGDFLLTEESIITFQNMSFSHMFYNHENSIASSRKMNISIANWNNRDTLYPQKIGIQILLTIKLEGMTKLKTKSFYMERGEYYNNGFAQIWYTYNFEDTIINAKISELFTYTELKSLSYSIQPLITIQSEGYMLFFPDDTTSVMTWHFEKYPIKENIMFGGNYNYVIEMNNDWDLVPATRWDEGVEFGSFKGIISGTDFYYNNESDNMSIMVPLGGKHTSSLIQYNLYYANFRELATPGGNTYNGNTGTIGEKREITGIWGWENIENFAHNVFIEIINIPLIKNTIGGVYAAYNWLKDIWNSFSALQGLGIFSALILGGIAFFIILKVGN